MIDIHPPHEPVTTPGEFFLHLSIITIGLLIAVGIEGAVEYFHHRHLVHEAEINLRQEIQHNANDVASALKAIQEERAALDKDIATMKRLQANPHDKEAQNASLNAQFGIVGLRDTAWKTAQTTGALTYMPYNQAQIYSDIYDTQNDFTTAEDKQLEDEAQFIGIAEKYPDGKDTPPQEATEMLSLFGVWKAHLAWIELGARHCDLNYKAFLEGKPAPTSLHEDMH